MDISQQLQQTPNWSDLNAYARAKICCELLSTLGLPIPSWMQIRQWIGKGSANDIHRAKQDFLAERHTIKTDWIQQDDLPSGISGSLQAWWQQLKQAAEQDYLAEKQQWQEDKAELQVQLSATQAQLGQQQQQIDQLQTQLEFSQQQYQQTQQALDVQQQKINQQAIEQQQLLALCQAQQQQYFAEQTRQQTQQTADRAQQQIQLEAQLNTVADFQRFAVQQIDLARQRQDQQGGALLDVLQQVQSEQLKQRLWQQQWLTEQSRGAAGSSRRKYPQRLHRLFRV